MPKRPSSSSSSVSPTTESKPLGPLDLTAVEEDNEEVKVNVANVTELKNACDDALKKYLSRPGLFKQNHIHTDVKLALGYASIIIAGATALYSYKLDFEESKVGVAIGVGLYLLLSSLSTIYSWAVEKDYVFLGKRRNFSGRIETDKIKLSSKTDFPPPSLATLPSRFISALSRQSSSKAVSQEPQYHVTFTYTLTASSGRSLLAKRTASHSKPYSAFFDEKGVLLQKEFTSWIGGIVQKAVTGEDEK